MLILVLGLRKGEALGLIEPDDDWRTDEDRAVIDLEWQTVSRLSATCPFPR